MKIQVNSTSQFSEIEGTDEHRAELAEKYATRCESKLREWFPDADIDTRAGNINNNGNTYSWYVSNDDGSMVDDEINADVDHALELVMDSMF